MSGRLDKHHEDKKKEEGGTSGSTASLQKGEKPLFLLSQRTSGESVPFSLSKYVQIPYTINRYLRDYQREGAKFIFDNFVKSRGCILGDDMGLGKTIQVISFLAAILHKTGTRADADKNIPHFLLSQKTVEQNKVKKDELDTWGYFKVAVVHGVEKGEELARVKKGRCEIALTTYETFRLCLDAFNSVNWAAVIVDEAHKIKNWKSQITKAMKKMRCKVRVGLTGTILQNNLEELYCVMDWAIPWCLGGFRQFKSKFAEPIEHGQKHSVTKRTLAQGRQAVQALGQRLSGKFLRRTKALISSQLPAKDDRVVYCSLTEFQQAVYIAVLESEDVILLMRSGQSCPCGSKQPRRKCCYKTNSKGVRVRNLYFCYLALLRKVANHVALLQSKEGTSKNQEECINAICDKVFQKFPEFVKRCKDEAFEAMSDPMYSGKMRVLQKLLRHFLQKKDKILLFSLSTKLLDVLESYCMAEGLEYHRLDGTTKAKDRMKIVKDFNSNKNINLCLVSTMAGGLGLNFVGANVVILFDPTWNPANDLQAIDRVYRIGQCRDVTVFRLISLGTVEEVIYLRQVYKQQLQSSVVGRENSRRYFEAVQGTDGQSGELFGMRNLFRLQLDGTCLTQRILEREGRVEAGVMTAKTQAAEARPSVGQTDPEAKGPTEEQAAGQSSGNQAANAAVVGVLDVSSDSEEEGGAGTSKAAATATATTPNGAQWATASGHCRLKGSFTELFLQGLQAHAGTDAKETGTATSDEGTVGGDGRTVDSQGWSPLNLSDVEMDEMEERRRSESPAAGPSGFPLQGKCREKTTVMRQRAGGGVIAETDEDERPGDDSEEESEDLLAPRTALAECPSKKDSSAGKKKAKRMRKTEDVNDSFSSSDDDTELREGQPATLKRKSVGTGGSDKDVTFTSLKDKQPQQSSTRTARPREETSNVGTIDALLGGLNEVSYTHSNQRVVGSSRAENYISKAAVRDVFERQRHSQVPAHMLLDSQQTQTQPDPEPAPPSKASHSHRVTEEPKQTTDKAVCSADTVEVPGVSHPVTHTLKAKHYLRNSTVIIGETPNSIRRSHFRLMAQFFGAASVEAFANELLKSTSEQRLRMLRQYYSQQNPDLTDLIKQTFPETPPAALKPATAPTTPSSSTPSSAGKKPALKFMHTEPAPKRRMASASGGVEGNNSRAKQSRTPGTETPARSSAEADEADESPRASAGGCRTRVLARTFQNPHGTTSDKLPPEAEPIRSKAGPCADRNYEVPKVPPGPSTDDPFRNPDCSRALIAECNRSSFNTSTERNQRDSDVPPDLSRNVHSKNPHSSKTLITESKRSNAEPHTERNREDPPDVLPGPFIDDPTKNLHSTKSLVTEPKRNNVETGRNRENPQVPQGQSKDDQSKNQHSSKSLITDLLGDTSILDGLFKPKPKADCSPRYRPFASNPAGPHVEKKAKAKSKDLWDILSEGNEESINQLTDLTQIEKICSATTSSPAKKDSQSSESSLWRKNDKFLWKKQDE